MRSTQLEIGRRGVQRQVIALYERLGCVVKRTSPGRRGGTFASPGISDLYVFPPLRGSLAPDRWKPFWHETKREDGKQRPGQVEFQELCRQRGVAYVLGGVAEALAYARDIGLTP